MDCFVRQFFSLFGSIQDFLNFRSLFDRSQIIPVQRSPTSGPWIPASKKSYSSILSQKTPKLEFELNSFKKHLKSTFRDL